MTEQHDGDRTRSTTFMWLSASIQLLERLWFDFQTAVIQLCHLSARETWQQYIRGDSCRCKSPHPLVCTLFFGNLRNSSAGSGLSYLGKPSSCLGRDKYPTVNASAQVCNMALLSDLFSSPSIHPSLLSSTHTVFRSLLCQCLVLQ